MAWSNTLMSPFKPKGETAQWRIVYDILRGASEGATVTYDQLAESLDMDPKADRARIQAAARKAASKLLETDNRAVEVHAETGYVMVPANRQIAMAGKQIERATHHIDKGKELTTHIQVDELSDRERGIVQAMLLGFSQVGEYVRQIGGRVDAHEDRLSDIEAELARLREQKD